MPFVLPLMLQLGFGMSPLGSGLLTFISAVGSLFMKTMSAFILRKWGFRTVLTVNAVVGGLTFAACGLFTASTSHAVILAVLLVGGCLRSLQFTGLNAISYAEVSQREMSQATSLASVAQQLAASFGVTIGAYALQASAWLLGHGTTLQVPDFRIAFAVIGVIAVSSVVYFWRLPEDAGAEMAGRSRPMAVAETPVAGPQG